MMNERSLDALQGRGAEDQVRVGGCAEGITDNEEGDVDILGIA